MNIGDVIVVTGAAKRIGREISLYLAQKGCKLVLHCNTSYQEALTLQKELMDMGCDAAVVQGDLSDTVALKALFMAFAKPFGKVDALVNSASAFSSKPIEEVDEAIWFHDMALHAAAPFFLSKYLYLHLKDRNARGSVVNITDTKLSNPTASRPSYYCSKGALSAETAALGVALAPVVRVNEIAPGLILALDDGLYFSRMEKTLPLQRTGNPQQLCEAVWYFLSSTFVTGDVLHIDGGQHLL
ncbi:SDR family oxidoreductase [uncultured Sphaerochaeta sp.]|uniref:SDR family oxidoreductase n=1 Tax=uncultured Sphaerochaeta sp. TaxID=886478 RepID=UPI002A0A1D6A|nr:SDR family oxidoreductase [uncultured Sphaerochaeta sp.]